MNHCSVLCSIRCLWEEPFERLNSFYIFCIEPNHPTAKQKTKKKTNLVTLFTPLFLLNKTEHVCEITLELPFLREDSMRRYSCIIQLVLVPLGALPTQKTRAFFIPTFLPSVVMILSVPVAFQYPDPATLLGLDPFGYFRSRGLKKYHSFSPNIALPVQIQKPPLINPLFFLFLIK